MSMILAVIALGLSVAALAATVTSWNAVLSGRASTNAIRRLAGLRSEAEVVWRFGAADDDGRHAVDVAGVFALQSRAARVYTDPVLDALIVGLCVVSVLSGAVPLIVSAFVFVMLWHWIGRMTLLDHAPGLDAIRRFFD